MLTLPVLGPSFHSEAHYRQRCGTTYALLPFRFIPLDPQRYVLSNLVGEHMVLPREELVRLVQHQLVMNSPLYDELKSRHFVLDGDSKIALELLATKYRSKQALLSRFTGLFMFVVSLRCDHSCPYCQVSRQSADRHAFDMQPDDADRAIEFMFQTPSQVIKVEFQGGEPLLNFDLIRHVVERVSERNQQDARDIQFVIATNLAYLTDEILDYCDEHEILISTSLDGPREMHNKNRPRPGSDSYEKAITGIQRIRERLGHDRVSALMTTTASSLDQPEAIIDEYVQQGFSSIFLRPLSPFGFAVKTGLAAGYNAERWLTFYQRALSHILTINAQGTPFREEYAGLLLRKILTPFATGYVDLQSPAGIGIAGLVFNYDGDIYASDEARMLAETGDRQFRLGNLRTHTFADAILSPVLLETLAETMTEGMPMCSDCGFQPYCGSDPVYHYATQQDVVGHKPASDFCKRNMGVMQHLFGLLEDDPVAAKVLRTWI